ncbi:MAG: protein kinase [Candidatus Dadabacteria bacterium]|nr:protein kinase [Candidatus Dadabacteria bacterium]NIS08240.1 protein kinase [Candidatus Dadabacteria bacterium]NIV41507.1 protein kinase [Candidatus Dadabacteria bacterium]NIY21728.1 protein kinase [Candidatus Dadabacteria bacterium]
MIGKTIGPYNIVSELGKGGMGVVYKAVHTTLEQQVAIKVLSTELSGNPSNRQRFIKEAKIQAKFTHPNVVNIFNFVEEGDDVFIVMEYVDGQTLDQKLKKEGTISEDEAINISIPVLEALEFMHSNGVVHRDIKPSNIMITNTRLVKVTDFGIAKIVDEKTQQTKTGMVGSLYYISPEQILGEKTSAATDVYSFGATLFHMVTGKALYDGTEYTIMTGHLEGKPAPPWEINENVSKNFGKVVLKAIQKAPKDRYITASAFSQDLKKVQSGASISFPMPRIIKNNQGRIKNSGFMNKRAIYGSVAGIFLLLSIIAFAFNRKPEETNPPPVKANSTIESEAGKPQIDHSRLQQAEPVQQAVTKTNIEQTGSGSAQESDAIEEDERFIQFDQDLYNEQKAREIEERNAKLEEKNKKLEEKLREEQKRYEEKAREARKRKEELRQKEVDKLRQEKEKEQESGGVKDSYKKVYNPVKKNVFNPIKKGFNKVKKKVR